MHPQSDYGHSDTQYGQKDECYQRVRTALQEKLLCNISGYWSTGRTPSQSPSDTRTDERMD
jgi:hypothetical protein